MTTHNLIITVPIHETDLDLSTTLAKRAADSAAFQFWTLANAQESDLSKIEPLPVLSMGGAVVATWKLQSPVPELPAYAQAIESETAQWGERFTTSDGVTLEWTHDMADGGGSGYAQVEDGELCGMVYDDEGDALGFCITPRTDDGTAEGGAHPAPHNIVHEGMARA